MKVAFWALLCMLLVLPSAAEFGDTDKTSFHVFVNNYKEIQTASVSGTIPIKFIGGYFGAESFINRSSDSWSHESRARIEGGYESDWIGIRGYSRYGRHNAMGVGSLIHGGGYGYVYLHNSDNLEVTTGLGTWAESVELLDILKLTQDANEDGIDFGLRAHLQMKWKSLSFLAEFLPSQDTYQVRVIPVYELHLFSKLYWVVTGVFEYRSVSRHIDSDNLQWTFSHRIAWEFGK